MKKRKQRLNKQNNQQNWKIKRERESKKTRRDGKTLHRQIMNISMLLLNALDSHVQMVIIIINVMTHYKCRSVELDGR